MGLVTQIQNHRWPNEAIPYDIDEADFPPDSEAYCTVLEAVEHWNKNTVLSLRPRIDEADYVAFVRAGDACSSYVGRRGGRQKVRCNLGAGWDVASVIHEIGHAVGFYHEQSRPDRDDHVEIHESRVEEGKLHNFERRDNALAVGDYDYGSIMHYPRGAFSNGDGDTIVPKGGQRIGQRQGLSAQDVWTTAFAYGVETAAVVGWQGRLGPALQEVRLAGFDVHGRRTFGDVVAAQSLWGRHDQPSVGMDRQGRIMAVWTDDKDGNGLTQVLGLVLEAEGSTVSRFTVNEDAAGNQRQPRVAVAPNGDFVVAWIDDGDVDGFYDIHVRGFDWRGNERFPQRRVNRNRAGRQLVPDVGIAEDGSFVVAWQDDHDGNGLYQVLCQAFNANGSKRRREFTVNTRGSGQQLRPRVAVDGDGDFVVAWEDDHDGNGLYQIYARTFDSDGSERASDRSINLEWAGQQLRPSVDYHAGRVLYVWQDDSNKNGLYEVFGTSRSPEHSVVAGDTTLNTRSGRQQTHPVVAAGPLGTFVAWHDTSSDEEIMLRCFTQAWQPSASPRVANRTRHLVAETMPTIATKP